MKRKILIIEDDISISEIMQIVLEEEGYEVLSVTTGDSLMYILEIMPDLILLDNWLPDRNGFELCLMLKELPYCQHIKVLLVSATQPLSMIANKCKADGFLEKPFDIDELVSLIKKNLSEIVNSKNYL